MCDVFFRGFDDEELGDDMMARVRPSRVDSVDGHQGASGRRRSAVSLQYDEQAGVRTDTLQLILVRGSH